MDSALLRSIFIESPVSMVILSREKTILSANRSFLNLSGMGSIRDRDFSDFLVEHDRNDFHQSFLRIIEGRTESTSTELRYRSNSERWCRLTLYPVSGAQRTIVVGFIEDVTLQKEREAELRRKNESSERAREAAEKETRIKSDFLANMSHEIRTPIHTITGMSELLGETKLDPEQQEYVDQIEFSADVLLSLINDVLDFSKIEAGKLTLEKIGFDLQKMAEDAVDLVSLEAHKKGLDTAVFIDNDVPCLLRGDPVRLRQIIVNLFNNAVKFTSEGEVVLTVVTEKETDNLIQLKFRVDDTGIGIAEEKKNRLFKVFSQVDSSTTRRFGGTGLGLSISKNLAELMEGRIGVESIEGEGSSFWFTAQFEKQNEAGFFESLPENYFQQKVLLVDDNARLRGFIRRYLENWGCEVVECSDGPAALECLGTAHAGGRAYDICLVDLLMPRMDGWQFASEVNASEELSETALILMSPTGKSGDEAKMKLLHWFEGYLSKPIKKSKLFEAVFRLTETEDEMLPELISAVEDELVELVEEITGGMILVVEDHEVNQQLFKTILENLGHEVHLANNGLEAVNAVKSAGYNLIFMDVQMPEMNGYEATREIRKMGIDTPIIAVTASALRGEEEKAGKAGMNDFLVKPFKKKDLLPVLNRWFENTVGTDSAEGDFEEDLEELDELEELEELEALEEVEDSDLSDEMELPYLPEDPVLDTHETLETFMGKRDVVMQLLGGFIDKVRHQITEMEAAVVRGDSGTVRSEAHAIKGGSLNLSAIRIGKTAAAIEEAAVENELNRAAALMVILKREFDDFIEVCFREFEISV